MVLFRTAHGQRAYNKLRKHLSEGSIWEGMEDVAEEAAGVVFFMIISDLTGKYLL